jgi:hypothetical protein
VDVGRHAGELMRLGRGLTEAPQRGRHARVAMGRHDEIEGAGDLFAGLPPRLAGRQALEHRHVRLFSADPMGGARLRAGGRGPQAPEVFALGIDVEKCHQPLTGLQVMHGVGGNQQGAAGDVAGPRAPRIARHLERVVDARAEDRNGVPMRAQSDRRAEIEGARVPEEELDQDSLSAKFPSMLRHDFTGRRGDVSQAWLLELGDEVARCRRIDALLAEARRCAKSVSGGQHDCSRSPQYPAGDGECCQRIGQA